MPLLSNKSDDDHLADAQTDPVIEEYKKHVDRSLIRFNLGRSVEQRLAALEAFMMDADAMRAAMEEAKGR